MSKKHPTVENILRANKAIRQAKNNILNIHFPRLGLFNEWKIQVFGDASWGNLPDGTSSAQGHVIFLTGKDNSCCPLSWKSNKVKRKVSSTLAAETLSLHDALDEAIYCKGLICETCFNVKVCDLPVLGFTDNKSLYENVYSTKQVNEKRLRINIAEIRRLIDEKEVKSIEWIEGEVQIADILTKRGVNPDQIARVFETGKLDFL